MAACGTHEGALESVCANRRKLTAAQCVRTAPEQRGDWGGQQPLVAQLAQPTLSAFNIVRLSAKSWDAERGTFRCVECESATDRSCVCGVSAGAAGATSSPREATERLDDVDKGEWKQEERRRTNEERGERQATVSAGFARSQAGSRVEAEGYKEQSSDQEQGDPADHRTARCLNSPPPRIETVRRIRKIQNIRVAGERTAAGGRPNRARRLPCCRSVPLCKLGGGLRKGR